MRIAILSFALAVPLFSGEKNARYVFSLIDSNFVVKARIDAYIRSTADPDTSLVKSVANSVSFWQVRLNPQPVGDVWLAYQPPADPGTVVFVSNTTPPNPLLTLRIDAMCGSCINSYSIFGSVSVPENTVTDGAWLDIVPLENDFGLGVPLTDEERLKIAGKLYDYALSNPGILSVRVHVLKWPNSFPSKDGIRYIAYFSFVDPTTSIPMGAARMILPILPQKEFDALGRSSKRLSPLPIRGWRTH